MPLGELFINGCIQHGLSRSWLLSLNTVSGRLAHTLACGGDPHIMVAVAFHCENMLPSFIHPAVD